MKIFFEGFYGFENAGDDAFVEVSSWGANKYWGCTTNFFMGDSLPKTITKISSSKASINLKGFDRITLINNLFNTNFFISAGGSTFSNLPFHSNKSIASLFSTINNKLSLGAIGVSIGPFKSVSDEKKVIKYLENLTFLALRDKRSFEFATSLNLNYKPIKAFDLAALLPDVYSGQIKKITKNTRAEHSRSKEKIIGISICNYESYTGGELNNEKKRNTFFKEVVALLVSNPDIYLNIFIINGNSKLGDLEISKELMKGISKDRFSFIPYQSCVKSTWEAIANCDLMISTRLHASIFACYANVPFILIEYHKKCADFLEDIGQSEDFRVYDAEKSPKEVFFMVEKILDNNYSKPKNILETIKLSEKNFTEIVLKKTCD